MNARTREAVRYSLTVFVAVRVGLFVLGLVVAGAVHGLDPVSVPGWPAPALADGGWHVLFTAWERFDALWFMRIAAAGYQTTDGSAAFFPLFPMLIHAVSFLIGGHTFAAAMLVSNGSFAAALCVLYLLTAEARSVRTARSTVLLVAIFPSALFFYAPYSEPLFLLLALVAFRAARRQQWVAAGVAGALAGLTRNVGIVLAPALLLEAIQQWRDDGRTPVPGTLAAAGPAIGAALYTGYWYERIGDALAPIHLQANWQRQFSWPWATLFHASKDVVDYAGVQYGGYWAIDWLIVVPFVVASVYAAVRYRPSYSVYLWGGLLIPLFYVFEPRPLMSMPRFVLPLFPGFWAIVELCERWRIPRSALIAASAVGLGCLMVLFVNWYYIF
ncbi:MAG: mannosyltransferase family protein [Actinomycetota bacterium]